MAVMRYREALNEALREEMQRDEDVFLMGEDIGVFNGAFKVTNGLLEEFGDRRVRDTPISENSIVGMGVGAAMLGLRPVVELMTVNFSLLALDQIVNSAAHIHYMFGGQARVPLVIRMPQGAGHQLGPTHSHCFEALYLHVPGLLVAVPSNAADAKGLLKAAIRDDNPVIFIEHEYLYGQRGDVPESDDFTLDFGRARIAREGTDITVVGIGATVHISSPKVEVIPFSTNDDLVWKLTSHAGKVDILFHTAALCDYRVQSIQNADGAIMSGLGKLPTREGSLLLTLEPTTKVLPQLRGLFPTAKLVGWKYEIDGTRENVIAKAHRQLTDCKTDACVVNGAAWGDGYGFVTPNNQPTLVPDKNSLCEFLSVWSAKALSEIEDAQRTAAQPTT